MRTLYIALIFVGCLSLALGVGPAPFPYNRPDPVACTQATGTAVGCAECQADPANATKFYCKTADKGYYLDTGVSKACPRACETCDSALVCTKCNNEEGFAPADDKSTPPILKCQNCNAGYSSDNGALNTNTNLDGICISQALDGTYLCKDGMNWNSAPSLTRKCVAKTEQCATGFSTDGTNSVASGNCNKCLSTKQQLITLDTVSGTKKIYSYSCIDPQTPPSRTVVDCSGTQTSTASCTKCESGKCTTPAAGFYPETTGGNTGKVLACPLQCATCTTNAKCDTCGEGYVKDGDNCKCDTANGYTPSIFAANATSIQTPYACVRQSDGNLCSTGFTWNSQAVIPGNKGVCLNINSDTACFTGDAALLVKGDMKNFWDSPPNPKRTCVLGALKTCASNYAQKQGDPSSTYDVDLTSNCMFCTGSLSLTSEPTNQVCVQNTSSFLVMSLAFLGVLLALVF